MYPVWTLLFGKVMGVHFLGCADLQEGFKANVAVIDYVGHGTSAQNHFRALKPIII